MNCISFSWDFSHLFLGHFLQSCVCVMSLFLPCPSFTLTLFALFGISIFLQELVFVLSCFCCLLTISYWKHPYQGQVSFRHQQARAGFTTDHVFPESWTKSPKQSLWTGLNQAAKSERLYSPQLFLPPCDFFQSKIETMKKKKNRKITWNSTIHSPTTVN